jgi:hypothetical protein
MNHSPAELRDLRTNTIRARDLAPLARGDSWRSAYESVWRSSSTRAVYFITSDVLPEMYYYKPIQQDAIKAAIMPTNVVLVVFVERS